MRFGRRLAIPIVTLLLLTGIASLGLSGAVAQDATPTGDDTGIAADAARPVHIHTGSCDSLGEVVGPLTDLSSPAGDAVGQAGDAMVEYSFTTVALALDAIVGADHAINAHESADEIQNYIACGNLGGVIDANGSLVIALHEQNDSDYDGIAVLTPNAADPTQTDVSVFIHMDADDDGADEDEEDETEDDA